MVLSFLFDLTEKKTIVNGVGSVFFEIHEIMLLMRTKLYHSMSASV